MVEYESRAHVERERVMTELRRELVAVQYKLWQLENLLLVTILVVVLVGAILFMAVVQG